MYLGPMVKNPIFRAYFSIVLSIFTIAIFLAFAVRPTISTIVSLQKQISDKQDLNRRLDEKINALSKLQNDYQMVEKDLPVIFSVMPENPAVSDAVILLEKTATASGVKLAGITIANADYTRVPAASGAAVASVSSSLVPVSLDITGEFDNIKNFLEQLAGLPRVIAPVETAVTKSTDGSLSTQARVNIYFIP